MVLTTILATVFAALKISGIGLVPIFIVLASAVFLWGMVVQNSLKTRKTRMETQLQNVGKAALLRMQLLARLGGLVQTDLVADQEGYDEAKLATEMARVSTAVKNLGFADHPEARQLQGSLAGNATLLVTAQRQFRAARESYNELCQRMPYKRFEAVRVCLFLICPNRAEFTLCVTTKEKLGASELLTKAFETVSKIDT